jgi:ribosomal protein L11 methylase PrmA
MDAEPGDLRLADEAAFGSGLHPTTALCLEAIEEAVTTRASGVDARRRQSAPACSPLRR